MSLTRRVGIATNCVYFTIDDGSNPLVTPGLLELLALHDVKASFFVLGESAQCFPDICRQIVDRGHVLLAHGYDHTRYTDMTEDERLEDLRRTEAVLRQFRPTPNPYLVRLPGGAGHGDPDMFAGLATPILRLHWYRHCSDARLAARIAAAEKRIRELRASAAQLSAGGYLGNVSRKTALRRWCDAARV